MSVRLSVRHKAGMALNLHLSSFRDCCIVKLCLVLKQIILVEGAARYNVGIKTFRRKADTLIKGKIGGFRTSIPNDVFQFRKPKDKAKN